MIVDIPPREPPGKELVVFWENFLTDDEIDKILAEPEWLIANEGQIMSVDDQKCTDKNIRKTKISWLDRKQNNAEIWHKISWAISDVNRQYFQFELTGCYEPFQLGCYTSDDNDHYDWHCDMAPDFRGVPRKLSMSLMLSDPDDFEGGELEVMTTSNKIQSLELKRGRAWFFPSWTLHRVTPVTKGIRRSLVCWVGGPPFK